MSGTTMTTTCRFSMCLHRSCSCPRYVSEFIRDWRQAGSWGERMIRNAHEGQLANLRAMLWERRHKGRYPHWCDLGDYVRSVRLLGRAAREGKGN